MKKTIILLTCLLFCGCAMIPHPQQYVSAHPELTPEIKHNILNKTVSVGMTKDQVIAVWGDSAKKGSFNSKHYSQEQWFYFDRYIVYFENNRVAAVDELAI